MGYQQGGTRLRWSGDNSPQPYVTKIEMFSLEHYFFTPHECCANITSLKMEARAHIFVSGRVQGVFFRSHTEKWASSLGLTGWVRNVEDGRVETLVEGDKEKIESLIGKLNQGPPQAMVRDLDVSWDEFKGEFDDFQITW